MKKVGLLLLFLLVLAGCSGNKNESETEKYLKETRKYINDITTFGKEISTILTSERETAEKMKLIKEKSEQMMGKAEDFNDYEYPSYLKHVHRSIVSQNYLLIDAISTLLMVIEAGDASVEAVKNAVNHMETTIVVEELTKLIKKIK